jgi:hypothetical protein
MMHALTNTGYLHIILLSKSELRGNRCSESHGLLKGVYEAFPLMYTVFSRLWQYLIQGKGKVKCTLVQALSLCTDRTDGP